MKVSYAITVCNESKEVYSLIAFLVKVKDADDEINVLLDSLHATEAVRSVLDHFRDSIVVHERDFCGHFAEHRNFHIGACTGDYIFVVDADEMPKEKLVTHVKAMIAESGADLIMVPRINIHPGATQGWLEKCRFKVNALDWINWPDYQGRIFKNDPSIRYDGGLHEMVSGAKKPIALQADHTLALWHIKTVEKQDARWGEDGTYVSPASSY